MRFFTRPRENQQHSEEIRTKGHKEIMHPPYSSFRTFDANVQPSQRDVRISMTSCVNQRDAHATPCRFPVAERESPPDPRFPVQMSHRMCALFITQPIQGSHPRSLICRRYMAGTLPSSVHSIRSDHVTTRPMERAPTCAGRYEEESASPMRTCCSR